MESSQMSSPRSVLNFSPFRFRSSRVASRGSSKAGSATNGFVHRLRIEPLEPRRMLTTYLIDSLADVANPDDDMLTLREALQAANYNVAYNEAPAGSATELDEIVFAPSLAGGTLAMTSGQFDVYGSTLIRGPEGGSVTIDAAGARRVFSVGTNVEAVISGLIITGGRPTSFGGAIRCSGGELTLVNSVITGNSAATYGGAISAKNSTVTI
ncbi:MAG TPA: hypothetical protein DD670_10495, partial [Planctomycetaceae bacterium]|nr:hypothetical protein [Planctomycetaceae bacterium]